jgi:phage-related protein
MLTIAYAVDNKGRSPGKEFFDALPLQDQAKLMRLFELLGNQGGIYNAEKFKNLKEGFFEFKSFQIRMLCRFLPGGVVLITHGFRKQRDWTPREEIDRAKKIFQQDQQRAGRAGRGEFRS